MQKITVLGGGLVGGFMARKLAANPQFEVQLADISTAALEQNANAAEAAGSRLTTHSADLSDTELLKQVIADSDLVIGAVPGFLGYGVLQTVLEAGKNCVDISFFPEDPFTLSEMAERQGLTAIVDCGVMPGLGGMLAAHFAEQLELRQRLSIMVGGLPLERSWPWEYRAPFSPADVIEEYLRPARLRIAGRTVEREALSEIELVDLPGVGTLEAFNTDGLRSLLVTLDFEDMVEKTLRYPGYAEKMRMLRHLGLFSDAPIDVGGQSVSPLALTSRLLFEQWRLSAGMQELTVMRVEAEGLRNGVQTLLACDLLDHTDSAGDFSMSRTTGYPAIVAAEMLLAGELSGRTGVIAPESLCQGEDSIAAAFFDRLSEKGIRLAFSEEERRL